jgi:hypothetical protein
MVEKGNMLQILVKKLKEVFLNNQTQSIRIPYLEAHVCLYVSHSKSPQMEPKEW